MSDKHQSAFVSIVGKPNVGKSTMMNALVGVDLAVTNRKAQTTRHRIRGILSAEQYQLVFSDTPGVLDPAYKLQESMMKAVFQSLEDADIIMYLVEAKEPIDTEFCEQLKKIEVPLIVVINKTDAVEESDVLTKMAELTKVFPDVDLVPTSAKFKHNTDRLLEVLLKYAPEHPAYFDKGDLSDSSDRFFISEIIRERILHLYKKEIPYSVEVVVENYKEEDKIHRIEAIIYVERDSQKIILIGSKGAGIKKLGIESRKKIEDYLGGTHIFLDLRVKTRKNWRSDDLWLKRFGYGTED